MPPPSPLIVFVKNVSLLNPSLDPVCTGGWFTPWLMRQGAVDASTRGGADASILVQQVGGKLNLADSLWRVVKFQMAVIPSADESLRELGTLTFLALHLFSAGRRHSSAGAELLRLI